MTYISEFYQNCRESEKMRSPHFMRVKYYVFNEKKQKGPITRNVGVNIQTEDILTEDRPNMSNMIKMVATLKCYNKRVYELTESNPHIMFILSLPNPLTCLDLIGIIITFENTRSFRKTIEKPVII